MANEETLRALLKEARRTHADCNVFIWQRCVVCERIDAALAEPVDDYDIDADLRMHKEDRLRLRVENLRLERERDESRAEVERLRSLYLDARSDGFSDGAKAMRIKASDYAAERARYWAKASASEGGVPTMDDRAEEAQYIAQDIHALLTPEGKS